MKCYDARRKLSALLDRAVPEAYERAVLGHLETCPACRAELVALARTDRALEKALAPSPPAGYFESFYARVSVKLETHAPELADVKNLARRTLERHAEKSAPEVPEDLLSAAPATLSQVVLPVPQPRKRRLMPLLSIAALGLGGVALFLIIRSEDQDQVQIQIPIQKQNLNQPHPASPPPPVAATPPATATATDAATDTATPTAPARPPKPKTPSPPTIANPAAAPPPPTPARPSDPILDELSRPAPPAPPPAAPSTGRDKLSHDEIKTGLDAVEPRVHACYEKWRVSGRVTLKLRIGQDGRVADAAPEPPFAGTDTGACVAAAARAATFPPFDGAPLSLRYTFTLSED